VALAEAAAHPAVATTPIISMSISNVQPLTGQVMLGQADDLGGGVFKKRFGKNLYPHLKSRSSRYVNVGGNPTRQKVMGLPSTSRCRSQQPLGGICSDCPFWRHFHGLREQERPEDPDDTGWFWTGRIGH
jgi:hypothetical protein